MGTYNHTLELYGGEGSSIHDLGIYIPAGTSGYIGLDTSATAKRIVVSEHAIQSPGRVGVRLLSGGTLADSTVALDDSERTSGVMLDHGPGLEGGPCATPRPRRPRDHEPLGRHGRPFADHRAYGTQSRHADDHGDAQRARVAQQRCRQRKRQVRDHDGGEPRRRRDRLPRRAVGDGDPRQHVGVRGREHPDQGRQLRDPRLRAPADAYAQGASTDRRLYTDFDPAGNEKVGPAAFLDLANNTNLGAAAGFADAASGDFHLLPGSPLIDAGDPASEDGLDLDGAPLIADGDGDGTARRDVGPFEAPVPPPLLPRLRRPERRRPGRPRTPSRRC